MGKSSRRTAHTAGSDLDPGDLPVVGPREPCPCGSGKRYRLCHGRAARQDADTFVARPFEGLAGECDWVAMREIVPAATAGRRLRAEHGGEDVLVATVLPMAWPAMRRGDGRLMVGLQTSTSSGDVSRDVAAALLAAVQAEPGTPVRPGALPGPGPRLQEVLEPDPLQVQVHEGFDFWLESADELDAEVRDSLERANAAAVPTSRLTSVPAAYWCRIGERAHLRWVMPHPEEALLDALARLHARGASALLPDSRYVGSFRADGLVVPVWDLAADTEAQALEEPAAAFEAALSEALAEDGPLSPQQRRARAGLASRQLTLR